MQTKYKAKTGDEIGNLALDTAAASTLCTVSNTLKTFKPHEKLSFRVPLRWQAPIYKTPYADEVSRRVVLWLKEVGCTTAEIYRIKLLDVGRYVGTPFPGLSVEKATLVAKFLSIWMLWDDAFIKTGEDVWRIEAEHLLLHSKPKNMNRFDEAWWQIFMDFADERDVHWISGLCHAMGAWHEAAAKEAKVLRPYADQQVKINLSGHIELRVATVGMYVALYLLEYGYGHDLPLSFYNDPRVKRIKYLSNLMVGLGNDIMYYDSQSDGKTVDLLSVMMKERNLGVGEAVKELIHLHDQTLLEFDVLADSLHGGWSVEAAAINQWLQDLRVASVGFSLWGSTALQAD